MPSQLAPPREAMPPRPRPCSRGRRRRCPRSRQRPRLRLRLRPHQLLVVSLVSTATAPTATAGTTGARNRPRSPWLRDRGFADGAGMSAHVGACIDAVATRTAPRGYASTPTSMFAWTSPSLSTITSTPTTTTTTPTTPTTGRVVGIDSDGANGDRRHDRSSQPPALAVATRPRLRRWRGHERPRGRVHRCRRNSHRPERLCLHAHVHVRVDVAVAVHDHVNAHDYDYDSDHTNYWSCRWYRQRRRQRRPQARPELATARARRGYATAASPMARA